jgi:hypothetical protein
MLGALAGSVGAGGGASLSMPSSATSALSDRSPINIAPVAFNMGEILQSASQGGPENGGFGSDFMARYAGGGQSPGVIKKGVNWPLMLAIPGALVALFFLMR